MELGKIAAGVRNRKTPNDYFPTPYKLAKKLISHVPIKKGDIILINNSPSKNSSTVIGS